MGLMDFIRGELLEIIEWTDDSRDTLSYRFPDEDKAIKNGAQLIVRESQVAQFVYLGEFGDTFGPGKHRLTTDNIPVLTRIKSWPYGFNSPFKADVYYVTTRLFTGNKWGTSNPVMLRDADFGAVRVRVTVGATTWSTSVFPDSKQGSYVLPVKKAVRVAEGLDDGDDVEVTLEVLDL